MRQLLVLILLILLSNESIVAQTIEGRILQATDSSAISFARVYNYTLKKGAISTIDGYFSIPIGSTADSVIITSVGNKAYRINFVSDINFYTVYPQTTVQLLEEIIVHPKSNFYLFSKIEKCIQKQQKEVVVGKSYYELKSFIDTQQIELIEGYYNAHVKGYNLVGLDLKAGRLALQPANDHFFLSMESSKAIEKLKLTEINEYFPHSILEMSKRQMIKFYRVQLNKSYLNDRGDSILVVSYLPKDTTGWYFEGDLWINTTKNYFEKVSLNCKHAKNYPFLPIFPTDRLNDVSLEIVKTFQLINGHVFFNEVHFGYTIAYSSRHLENSTKSDDFQIRTNALLYAYDFENQFILPQFEIRNKKASDYERIIAMPYNSFFWSMNDEYRLHDWNKSNALFFTDEASITNRNFIGKSNPYFKRIVFEYPYLKWSKKRIFIRDHFDNEHESKFISKNELGNFQLGIITFFDHNYYKDSLSTISATIIDPYDTFLLSKSTDTSNCIVNMIIDLHEMERRKFEVEIMSLGNSPEDFLDVYKQHVYTVRKKEIAFVKEVSNGTNMKAIERYNQLISSSLGVDNVRLFQLNKE